MLSSVAFMDCCCCWMDGVNGVYANLVPRAIVEWLNDGSGYEIGYMHEGSDDFVGLSPPHTRATC